MTIPRPEEAASRDTEWSVRYPWGVEDFRRFTGREAAERFAEGFILDDGENVIVVYRVKYTFPPGFRYAVAYGPWMNDTPNRSTP